MIGFTNVLYTFSVIDFDENEWDRIPTQKNSSYLELQLIVNIEFDNNFEFAVKCLLSSLLGLHLCPNNIFMGQIFQKMFECS
jgi:hypothetical protein